jgi:hypothetical protein
MSSPLQAVAEFEMGDLQPGAGAVDHRIVLATVELEGLTRCKLQRKAGVLLAAHLCVQSLARLHPTSPGSSSGGSTTAHKIHGVIASGSGYHSHLV